MLPLQNSSFASPSVDSPRQPLVHCSESAPEYGLRQAKGSRLDAYTPLRQGVQEDQASLIPLSDGGAGCGAFWFGAVKVVVGQIQELSTQNNGQVRVARVASSVCAASADVVTVSAECPAAPNLLPMCDRPAYFREVLRSTSLGGAASSASTGLSMSVGGSSRRTASPRLLSEWLDRYRYRCRRR